MIIINAFFKSYPQITGLAQIIQKFLYVLSAVILKPSAQSAKSVEKCMEE
jgi:hypothetical protein